MTVTPKFTDEQARALIRAASVHGRELAESIETEQQRNALVELDKARHALEAATDDAGSQ